MATAPPQRKTGLSIESITTGNGSASVHLSDVASRDEVHFHLVVTEKDGNSHEVGDFSVTGKRKTFTVRPAVLPPGATFHITAFVDASGARAGNAVKSESFTIAKTPSFYKQPSSPIGGSKSDFPITEEVGDMVDDPKYLGLYDKAITDWHRTLPQDHRYKKLDSPDKVKAELSRLEDIIENLQKTQGAFGKENASERIAAIKAEIAEVEEQIRQQQIKLYKQEQANKYKKELKKELKRVYRNKNDDPILRSMEKHIQNQLAEREKLLLAKRKYRKCQKNDDGSFSGPKKCSKLQNKLKKYEQKARRKAYKILVRKYLLKAQYYAKDDQELAKLVKTHKRRFRQILQRGVKRILGIKQKAQIAEPKRKKSQRQKDQPSPQPTPPHPSGPQPSGPRPQPAPKPQSQPQPTAQSWRKRVVSRFRSTPVTNGIHGINRLSQFRPHMPQIPGFSSYNRSFGKRRASTGGIGNNLDPQEVAKKVIWGWIKKYIYLGIAIIGGLVIITALIATIFGGSNSDTSGVGGGGVASSDAGNTNTSNPITLTKSGPSEIDSYNKDLPYTITVTYNGQGNADITVTDPIPYYVDEYISFKSASDGGKNDNGTVTWNVQGLSSGQSKTLSLILHIHNIAKGHVNQIDNTATATLTSNTSPSNTSQDYVDANTNDCGGKYTADILKFAAYGKDDWGKNYGDPSCDYNLSDLHKLLRQLDPNNADKWYYIIVLGQDDKNDNLQGNGSGECGGDPNAWAPPVGVQATLDNRGGWGCFQMGSSNPPFQKPPSPGQNGIFDRGDVNWQVQAKNAVDYNNDIRKKTNTDFCYWATARQAGFAIGCNP